MDADRNLLFAVLALQGGYLTRDTFVSGCALWAANRLRPLPDLLVARGWLSPADRGAVEEAVNRAIGRHTPAIPEAIPIASAADIAVATADATPSPRQLIPVPADAPRYTVTRLHASGGIGRVWVASDATVGREVALKDLRPERSGNPAVWPRFLREARVTGRLQHPGIVPVYEIGTKPGTGEPFYTMRLIHGETLEDAVQSYHRRRANRTAGPLDLRDLLAAFGAICQTVAYAHDRNVLHRDLKPQNVVLGKYGEVIVLDWGLARLLDRREDPDATADPEPVAAAVADVDAPAPTVQGAILGTPAYMAPEQARGELDALGPWTDVYGLGAILYEILTGRPPFTGTSTAEVLEQVRSAQPERPRSVVRSIPRPLQAVCLKATAKRPSERYPTAKELADEVRRFLADEPVSAYRDPPLSRLARRARRNKPLVAAVLAAVVVLSVGGTALGVRHSREQERARAEAALRAEQERAEEERLRAEAERLHSVGLTASRSGDVNRATAILSEAVGFCQQSPALSSKRQEIARHLADVERYRNFTAKARVALQAGLDLTPPDERSSRPRLRHDPTQQAAEHALSVYSALSRTDWDRGLRNSALSEAQVGEVRQAVHELLLTVAAEVVRRDPRRALELLDRAEQIEPPGHGTLFLRADCLNRLHNEAEALKIHEKIQKMRDSGGAESARQHYLFGLVPFRLGLYKEALLAFRAAAQLDPGLFQAHFAQFICGYELNETDELITPLTACLVLRPNEPELYYLRGMLHFQRKQFSAARRDFEAAVARDPNYAVGHFYRGRMRVIFDEWAGAEQDFTRAVDLDARLTQARSWRAIARAKTGRPAEAAADAEQCAREEPDEPLTLFYAARALAQCVKAAQQAGDARAASRYADRSVALLQKAVENGFNDADRLRPGGDFEPVRDRPEILELLKKLPPPKPRKDAK